MDQERERWEPVRLEVEVLIDAIDAIDESNANEDALPDAQHNADALPQPNQREAL